MRCNGKEKKEECNSIGKTYYDENKLLERIRLFHWDKFFSDKKHDQSIINKRKLLQENEGRLNQIKTHINKIFLPQNQHIYIIFLPQNQNIYKIFNKKKKNKLKI